MQKIYQVNNLFSIESETYDNFGFFLKKKNIK